MKLKFYALLSAFSILTISHAQQYSWSAAYGGVGEDVTRAMAIGADGSSYSAGYFTDNGDFDPGLEEWELNSEGFFDVFVQKLNSEGQLEWALSFGGAFFDYATGIAVDADGYIYVTGVFSETCDFDPGVETFELTSAGAEDIFVVKLSPEGDLEWARSMGSPEYEESTGIGVDEAGNVTIGGYFMAAGDYNPGEEENMLSSNGGQDIFVVKLDVDGNFLWAHAIGGPGQELAMALKVSLFGDIYLTGLYNETVDFDPGFGELLLTSENSSDAFLLKLNAFGDATGANSFGGQGSEIGLDLAIDSEGNAIVVGNFFGNFIAGDTELTNTSNEDGFIVKVSPFGFVDWARGIQGEGFQNIYCVATGINGEVNVAGYFSEPADFNPSEIEEFEMTPESSEPYDAFFVQLTSAGEFSIAQQFGGSNFLESHEIGTDAENSVYLGGAFQSTVDLNPASDAENEATVAGFRDSYVIKLALSSDGVHDRADLKPIDIFPNPLIDFLNVSVELDGAQLAYQLFAHTGKLVKGGFVSFDNARIDLSTLSQGVYVLHINGYQSQKIVKQ